MWIRLSLHRPCRGSRIDRFHPWGAGDESGGWLDFEIGVELETGLISCRPRQNDRRINNFACVIQNFWNGQQPEQVGRPTKSARRSAAEKPCPRRARAIHSRAPSCLGSHPAKLPTPAGLCKPNRPAHSKDKVRGSGIRPQLDCDEAAVPALRLRDKEFARPSVSGRGFRCRIGVFHVTGSVSGENGGTLGSTRSVSKGYSRAAWAEYSGFSKAVHAATTPFTDRLHRGQRRAHCWRAR